MASVVMGEGLNELLEAERAGVETLSALKRQYPSLGAEMERIENDEAWACSGLARCIRAVGGTASQNKGDFAAKVLALPTLGERLQLLIRGQLWVMRKIDALLNEEPPSEVASFLQEMREAHRENIVWCQSQVEALNKAD